MVQLKKAVAYALLGFTMLACAPSAAPAPAPAQPPAAQPPAQPAAPVNPVDSVTISGPTEIVFWHTQTGATETLLKQIVDDFQKANPNITVKVESPGDYTKLDQKVVASIQAGTLPNIATIYESMAAPYWEAKANVPFDDYISSKKYGLSEEDQKDMVPGFMEATKFPQYNNIRLTYPFAKSSLTWYSNMEVLKAANITKVPATWDELVTTCKAVVGAGKQCLAFLADASQIDGMVFSNGGKVVSADGKKPLFDSPEAMKVLNLIESMTKDKLTYLSSSGDAQNDFVAGKTAFYFRSSTSVPFLHDLMKDPAKWQAGLIPQGSATNKATVLYGGNIGIFKSSPEKQLASWLFIKYWNSKEVTTKWGIEGKTGYWPVRLSAMSGEAGKKMIETIPQFKTAHEASNYGLVEPSVTGWQEMRPVLADAVTAILTGKATAAEASKQIQEKGTKVLSGM